MDGYYILDGKTPVPTSDLHAWGRMFDDLEARRVARDEIGSVSVSTVFIGLNHRFGDGPPLLFETMIFGGEHDQYQDRCSTWAEAEAMHAKAVALVRGEAP